MICRRLLCVCFLDPTCWLRLEREREKFLFNINYLILVSMCKHSIYALTKDDNDGTDGESQDLQHLNLEHQWLLGM
jgi:hypothetical protein